MTEKLKKALPESEAPKAEPNRDPLIIAMQAAWHTAGETATYVYGAYRKLETFSETDAGKDTPAAELVRDGPFQLGAAIGMLSRTRAMLEQAIVGAGGELPVLRAAEVAAELARVAEEAAAKKAAAE